MRVLFGVSGLAGDGSQEFGQGVDGLTVFLAVDEPGVEAPPVGDFGDESRGDLAAGRGPAW